MRILICTCILGKVFECLYLARAYMSHAGAWRLYRYLNAAHILGYVGLPDDVYNEKNIFRPLNNMYALLTDNEVHRIQQIGFGGGSAYREVLAWIVECIMQEKQEGVRIMTSVESDSMTNLVFILRSKMGGIHDYIGKQLILYTIYMFDV